MGDVPEKDMIRGAEDLICFSQTSVKKHEFSGYIFYIGALIGSK